MKKIEKLILISVVLGIIFYIPHAFAYDVRYQSLNQPVFTRIPTVCTEQPTDFPTSQGQLDLYMQTIQDRVSEWSSRLQEGATNVNEWKIKYVVFDPQKDPNFDLSSCDILVVLQAVPHGYDPNAHNFLGYEQYEPESGLRKVVVNYESYKNCGYPPSYSGYACPTGNYLTIPQLNNVILHELGHALGLGHYVSDDPKVMYAWDLNPTDAPSIMIPYVTVNPQYQHVQEIDVQEIHNMYNYKGFLAFASNTVNPFDSITANAYVTEINGDATPVVSVTAKISNSYYNRGDKIYIQITDSEGHQIYDQDFVTTDSFSQVIIPQGLVTGTYTLNAVYDGMKSPDTTFVFSNTPQPSIPNPTSTTASKFPIPASPSNSMLVDGTDYSINYNVINGHILGTKMDSQSKSLIASLQTTGNGVLTITLPRALIDAKVNGQDDPYYVLNDGQGANFQETSTTTTDRTLSIPFTDGTQEIEIIGTWAVPEFGSSYGFIMIISVILSITITRRYSKIKF